jgi:predicted deacylase
VNPDIVAETPAASRKIVRVPVCTLLSGLQVSLTFHVVKGASPGPTLALLSTSHGAEFLSIEQVRWALDSIDVRDLRGTVLACPVANPIALEQLRITTPTDEINMNRIYPGADPAGLLTKYAGGVTEYMAHLVTTHLIDPCDVLLDFHLGPYGHAIETIDVPTQTDPTRLERLRGMAALFGVSIHEWELFPGSAVGYAVRQGKLAMGVEIGGGGFGNAQTALWVDKAARGIRSVMQQLDMLPGTPVWPESVPVVTNRAGIRPLHGGYHVPGVGVEHLGQTVEAGRLLGRTYDVQTFELVDELRSPHRGLLYMVRAYGPIHPGDWGYVVGDERGQRVYRPAAGQ